MTLRGKLSEGANEYLRENDAKRAHHVGRLCWELSNGKLVYAYLEHGIDVGRCLLLYCLSDEHDRIIRGTRWEHSEIDEALAFWHD